MKSFVAVAASMLLLLVCALAFAQKNFSGKSLTGLPAADFTDEDCSHASFQKSTLFVPHFVRTNLSGADFTASSISGGSFAFADLRGADFTDADLSNANLADAKNLGSAIFCRTRFRTLNDVDMSGADLHGIDFVQAQFVKATLRRVKLSHCNLTQAVFTDADLRDADLTFCNLTQADFRGADLRGADLTGSTLTQARVERADLSTARGLSHEIADQLLCLTDPAKLPPDFPPSEILSSPDKSLAELRNQPDMDGTDMRRMNLHQADLSELLMQGSLLPSDLTGANLRDINAGSIRAENADFTGADLQRANLAGSWLIGSKLSTAKYLGSANLSGCRLDRSDFSRAQTAGIKLDNAILRNAILTSGNFQRAKLDGVCLIGADLRNCDLRNATFNEANVAGADFTGANLAGTDLSETYGLTHQQVDEMAQKPARLPDRLDPSRRTNAEPGSNGSSHETDDSASGSWLLMQNWWQNPSLRKRVLEWFFVPLGITMLLALTTVRGSLLTDEEKQDRWQNVLGSQFRFLPRAKNDQDMHVTPTGTRMWPSFAAHPNELPLPLLLEVPARVGPRGVRFFILINGLVISLLLGVWPISINRLLPLLLAVVWVVIALLWLGILSGLRGKLIAIDRTHLVLAVMKASNASQPAKLQTLETSHFRAVTWQYAGATDDMPNVEITNGIFIPTVIALGKYPVQEAVAMRQCLVRSLKIAEKDEQRVQSSD